MATTTNYGWTTPDDTDLVKDGAAAIRTLGSSVDTTTKNLNPETTLGDMSFRSATSNVNTRLPIGSSGQHLTVVAGVPAWATASDQTPLTTKGDLFTFSTVDARLGVGTNDHRLVAASGEATGLKYVADTQNTVIDAEGDLLVGDAADALQRLAIGSNAQVLTVDTAVDGKIKWAAPAAGGGMTSIASGSLSGGSLSLTSISGSYKNLQLILRGYVTGEDYLRLRFNNLSTSIYDELWVVNNAGGVTTAATADTAQIICNYNSVKENQTGDTFLVIDIYDYANTTTQKNVRLQTSYIRANNTAESSFVFANAGLTAAINRIDIVLSTTFSAGTYILYGVS